jgi:hypothetical protein
MEAHAGAPLVAHQHEQGGHEQQERWRAQQPGAPLPGGRAGAGSRSAPAPVREEEQCRGDKEEADTLTRMASPPATPARTSHPARWSSMYRSSAAMPSVARNRIYQEGSAAGYIGKLHITASSVSPPP